MIIIAKNQTVSALALDQIPVTNQEIPASGQVRLTDFASITEIQEDQQLIAHITAGDVILNIDGVDLTQAKSLEVTEAGESNTVANVGAAGVGVFKQKSGINLEFKNLNARSNRIIVADDTANNEIDLDVEEVNLVHQNIGGAGTNTHAQIDTHLADTANPHATDIENLGNGTLAELNASITDATLDNNTDSRPPNGSATGDLTGSFPGPTLVNTTVIPGSYTATDLTVGADGRITAASSGSGGGSGVIACCLFGGDSDSKGKFLIANGKATDADSTSIQKTRQPIIVDGTLTKLAYSTENASSSTIMKVHVNGSVEATVTLTNINSNGGGVETISVSVSAGDYVEIEYDNDDAPRDSTWYFLQEVS
jgi:hypothetical protein